MANFSPDKSTSTILPTAIRNTFYNTTTEIWQERAASQLGKEPMISFLTPLELTKKRFGQVPRAYIECLQDEAIPIALQRDMTSTLPCEHIISLDTDHSPFYSAPEELASKLCKLAVQIA